MPVDRHCKAPPMISKMGPYTVFITPSSPTPALAACGSPKKVVPPPVQPPPQQLHKSAVFESLFSIESAWGFFKHATFIVQNAHSSLDSHLARWLGLDQSKYQWALENYNEDKLLGKEGLKAKETSSKLQNL